MLEAGKRAGRRWARRIARPAELDRLEREWLEAGESRRVQDDWLGPPDEAYIGFVEVVVPLGDAAPS